MTADAPGLIGSLGQLGTVHPHEPWQLLIIKGVIKDTGAAKPEGAK